MERKPGWSWIDYSRTESVYTGAGIEDEQKQDLKLTIHKKEERKVLTPEEIENGEEDWIIATHRPTGKSLGS